MQEETFNDMGQENDMGEILNLPTNTILKGMIAPEHVFDVDP